MQPGTLPLAEEIAAPLGGVGRVELGALPLQGYGCLLPRIERGVWRVLAALGRLIGNDDASSGPANGRAGINLGSLRHAGAANQCQCQ